MGESATCEGEDSSSGRKCQLHDAYEDQERMLGRSRHFRLEPFMLGTALAFIRVPALSSRNTFRVSRLLLTNLAFPAAPHAASTSQWGKSFRKMQEAL